MVLHRPHLLQQRQQRPRQHAHLAPRPLQACRPHNASPLKVAALLDLNVLDAVFAKVLLSDIPVLLPAKITPSFLPYADRQCCTVHSAAIHNMQPSRCSMPRRAVVPQHSPLYTPLTVQQHAGSALSQRSMQSGTDYQASQGPSVEASEVQPGLNAQASDDALASDRRSAAPATPAAGTPPAATPPQVLGCREQLLAKLPQGVCRIVHALPLCGTTGLYITKVCTTSRHMSIHLAVTRGLYTTHVSTPFRQYLLPWH